MTLDSRADVMAFLGSPAFQQSYWERHPLLIHTQGAFLDTADLRKVCRCPPMVCSPQFPERNLKFPASQVLRDKYAYLGQKENPPHRNIKFLGRGTFQPEELQGLMGEKELRAALQAGHTLQMYSIQYWMPPMAALCHELTTQTMRPSNINMYVTPGGRELSLRPHNDFQCSLMVQLTGRKRWRLWLKRGVSLPISNRYIIGRDGDELLDFAAVGEPYMDVTLGPGDILYVPRGVLHATSTPAGTLPSMHLTVGMEVLWDLGMSNTWTVALGGGGEHQEPRVMQGYFQALGQLADRHPDFRQSVPVDMLRGRDGLAAGSGWRAELRRRLHALVDEMMDNTPMAARMQGDMRRAVQASLERLVERFGARPYGGAGRLADTGKAKMMGELEAWYADWMAGGDGSAASKSKTEL